MLSLTAVIEIILLRVALKMLYADFFQSSVIKVLVTLTAVVTVTASVTVICILNHYKSYNEIFNCIIFSP